MPLATFQTRKLQPEILDQLAATDARAVASRRDLTRVNAVMLQAAIMTRLLRRCVAGSPRRVVDIGAGDGAFSYAVARRLSPIWPQMHLTLVDRKDAMPEQRRLAFAALGWTVEIVTTDIFAWLAAPPAAPFDAAVANLFLHHFDDIALAALLDGIAAITGTFVATEPRRNAVGFAGASMLWLLGANDVSRHDARASVRAGFRGDELSALWPKGPGWRLTESLVGPFTHGFAAVHNEGGAH